MSISLDLSLSGRHRAFGGISIDAFLAAMGLTGSNAGADFNAGRYWLPSIYDTTKPVECREDDWFAQFQRASSGTGIDANGDVVDYAVNKPRFIYDGGKRYLSLNGANTNLFLSSNTPVTQNITTTAQSYTLSFFGTGSVVLSGSASGTLNGTGANNRVSLTVTAASGTLSVTPTGAVNKVQLEQSSFATPYIPTAGSAVTRAVDSCRLPTAMEGVIKQQNSSVICRYFEKFNPNSPPIPERQHILFINDGGYGRYVIRRINVPDPVPMAVIGSSVVNTDMRSSTPVTSANTPVGVALAVGSSGTSYSVNGSLTTTATVWDYASNLTKSIYVGRSDITVTILPLQMGLIAAFPLKLSDAKLQALTGNLSWI